MSRTFRSDNNAGVCHEAMQALAAANDGCHVTGYGDDAWTSRATSAFRSVFGEDLAVFFVATGTAANTLAIAALSEPWQRIVCHQHSHLNADESTAPERLTHMRLSTIDTPFGRSKLTVDDLRTHAFNARGDVHEPAPGVLSISNPTEFGEVYNAAELRDLSEAAHAAGYCVHVDGARFANAVAATGNDPIALSRDAGIDALSFGGTKNGLALGEAVVFFPQGDRRAFERATATFPFHRKGTGHLLSKHRFVAAPFAATLSDGVWLRHASNANQCAEKLGRAMNAMGIDVPYAVEANAVFAVLSPETVQELRGRGHQFYMFGEPGWNLARLMCSFDTQAEDVTAFVADLQAATTGRAVR